MYAIGDHVVTMITGMAETRRARVIGYDTRYDPKSTIPVLEVLNADGSPDLSWPMKLKDGDHIIQGPWKE